MKAVYSGRVASFDDHVGRGEVEARGGLHFPFHCTAIADGTRTIEVGASVAYSVRPGLLGRFEAAGLRPA